MGRLASSPPANSGFGSAGFVWSLAFHVPDPSGALTNRKHSEGCILALRGISEEPLLHLTVGGGLVTRCRDRTQPRDISHTVVGTAAESIALMLPSYVSKKRLFWKGRRTNYPRARSADDPRVGPSSPRTKDQARGQSTRER
jgi:hypothetical protein